MQAYVERSRMKRDRANAILNRVVTVLAWLALAWAFLTVPQIQGVPRRSYWQDVLSLALLGASGGALLWLNISGPRRWEKTVLSAGFMLFPAHLALEELLRSYKAVPYALVATSFYLSLACLLVGVLGAWLRSRPRKEQNPARPME